MVGVGFWKKNFKRADSLNKKFEKKIQLHAITLILLIIFVL
jgi:hypothetical protein